MGALARGAGRGVHIPKGRRSVGWNWTLTDGAGFRWDINSNGMVSDGTNDAYDGGMQLQVNGSSFSWGSSGRLGKDGREVEIGPWSKGPIRVYRRIYVDGKIGYCRWIDIFENTAASARTLTLRYYSNMGASTRRTYTTGGRGTLTDRDWGLVTGYRGRSSRPAVIHVFATRGARNKPRMEYSSNNDNIYHYMTLKVPAGKTVAVCLFEAQRRPFDTAMKFLRGFRPSRELRKVPAPLRRIIVNMGGFMLTLGTLELPRHDKFDLAVLRNGDELLGTILNDRFLVETFYGRLDLPANRVVGIAVPTASDPHVRVGLTDGQVIAGRLLSAPLRFKLANGNEMALKVRDLQTAAFRLSSARPEQIPVKQPIIVLRSGQRLFFRRGDLPLDFQSEYGLQRLRSADIMSIQFDTAGGGLHRVEFRNGSVLSGLLAADELKLKLDLGPMLTIPRHLALRVMMPASSIAATLLSTMTLRNGDTLYGRIAEEKFTVRTGSGLITVASDTVAEITFHPEILGPVQIKLRNGTTVSGTLIQRTIRFRIVPGPTLGVFTGYIMGVSCPEPPKSPKAATSTTAPTSAPV